MAGILRTPSTAVLHSVGSFGLSPVHEKDTFSYNFLVERLLFRTIRSVYYLQVSMACARDERRGKAKLCASRLE